MEKQIVVLCAELTHLLKPNGFSLTTVLTVWLTRGHLKDREETLGSSYDTQCSLQDLKMLAFRGGGIPVFPLLLQFLVIETRSHCRSRLK